MTLDADKKHQLNKLLDYRDDISGTLFQIERILKEYFPKEYDIAYQHWIPQISTALDSSDKWLSRGEYNMQQTIDRLLDQSDNIKNKGVSKFI